MSRYRTHLPPRGVPPRCTGCRSSFKRQPPGIPSSPLPLPCTEPKAVALDQYWVGHLPYCLAFLLWYKVVYAGEEGGALCFHWDNSGGKTH